VGPLPSVGLTVGEGGFETVEGVGHDDTSAVALALRCGLERWSARVSGAW